MDEPGFELHNANVAIIGLGLMGGSMALALKGHCRLLSAVDTDPLVIKLAYKKEMVNQAACDAHEILENADLVILACPVPSILDWLKKLPGHIQSDCIVLDLGSTKRTIISAMEALPENFDPIGCHPMCGKEHLSLINAEGNLFRGAPFLLSPLKRTTSNARNAALELCKVIEAKPVWVSAENHDRLLAVTSHLPFLLASALTLITPEEAEPFTGPGFHSSTRLAATPSSMMLGVLQSNRDEILSALSILQGQLAVLENALRENENSKLNDLLDLARNRYESWVQQNKI
jgi:prephenate dehydrogenase